MLASILRRLWKKDIFKTIITLALIPILISCFWFGLPKVLNTSPVFPLFVVTSGSMCIPSGPCDTFSHAFEETLHIGDLILIQGIDVKDLKTDYPNSDIIVFRDPTKAVNDPKANIVHRIIAAEEVNGTSYFHTKGDGNQNIDKWSSTSEDPSSTYNDAISENYVYGKVVMRVPWIGSLALFSQEYNVIPIILGLIILIIVVEFCLPLIRKEKTLSTDSVETTILENENYPNQESADTT